MTLKRVAPYLLLFGIAIAFFWKFFFKGLVPIPADITVGLYFPWLDYKWGYVVGVPVKNPLISDTVSQVYPWKTLALDLIKAGQLPLWNPYSLSGYPLLANFASGVFYPLNLLHFLFDHITARGMFVFLQVTLSLTLMFAFLKNLKLSFLAAIFGAAAFAFSGFMMVNLEEATGSQGLLWLPLLFLLIDLFARNPSGKKIVAGAVVLAAIITAGHFQPPFYAFATAVLYALFRIRQKGDRKIILWFLVMFVAGVLLSAVQLLPSLELFPLSIRQEEGYVEGINFGLLPLFQLPIFFAPDFFGNPVTRNYWGHWNYREVIGYFGLIPTLFALWLLIRRWDKDTKFFAFVFLAAFVFLLDTPISKLPYLLHLPAISTSAASRLLSLVGFSGAALAAFGADRFLKKDKWSAWPVLAGFTILSGLTLGVAISALWLKGAQAAWPRDDALFGIYGQEIAKLVVSLRNLILPWAVFLASSMFLLLGRVSFLRKTAFAAVFLITLAELFRFGWKYNPFISPELVFPTTPVTEFLQEQERPFRVLADDTVMPSNMWIPYRIEFASGYDPLYPKRMAEFLSTVQSGKPNLALGRYARIDKRRFDSPLVSLMNVRYFLLLKYDENGRASPDGKVPEFILTEEMKPVFEDGSVVVFENKAALKRAFLVHSALVEKNDNEVLNLLVAEDFDPREVVILEKGIPLNLPSSDDVVEITSYGEQGEMIIKTASSQDGYLVVSHTYYPGWIALVDGQPAEILRADYTFQAIPVPAGEHEVKLAYQPESFRLGATVSGATGVFLAGILVADNLRRRANGKSSRRHPQLAGKKTS